MTKRKLLLDILSDAVDEATFCLIWVHSALVTLKTSHEIVPWLASHPPVLTPPAPRGDKKRRAPLTVTAAQCRTLGKSVYPVYQGVIR